MVAVTDAVRQRARWKPCLRLGKPARSLRLVVTAIMLWAASIAVADDPPLVWRFLASGELARGELTLERELEDKPGDDQLRFGLGVLQIFRGFERLGQSLYLHGAKSSNEMFLRLPVPENSDPAPINVVRFARILDDLRCDLSVAEATLAKITADDVHLRLKLADIQLDLDADGKPTDKFGAVLEKVFRGQRLEALKLDPGFQVNFDRGDVAWMRAYCHLLMAIIDGTLSAADEPSFILWAGKVFAKPVPSFDGTQEERWRRSNQLAKESVLKEPKRLQRTRRHLIRVCELNQETWKFIRAETDDDHEWLPNSKQTGVMRLPVRDEMITAWLKMTAELKLLLEGERLIPNFWDGKHKGKGLNIKLLLDDPPLEPTGDEGIPEKYFTEGKMANIEVFWIIIQMFSDPSLVGYPVWFN